MKGLPKFTGLALLASVITLVPPPVPSAQAGAGYAKAPNEANNWVRINRLVTNGFKIEFCFNSTQAAGATTQWWQGMGGRNRTVALKNDFSGVPSAEFSTDLLNGSLPGPAGGAAVCVLGKNAPAGVQLYHRLRWP